MKAKQKSFRNWPKGKRSLGELYFTEVFNKEKFPKYEIEFPVGKYRLDFAWPQYMKYVEIDGEQHYTKDGKQHDKIRTKILSQFGWSCIARIRWEHYQDLSDKKQNALIQKLYKNISGSSSGGRALD